MYSFWFRVILGGVHHKLYPGKSENWKFTLWPGMFAGGYIISFTWVKLTFPYICLWYLYVYISALVFPYIFLLVDHFEWALIGNIGQQRVDSVFWQFQMGGRGDISLYILISWPFWMGSHWQHWTAKSWLSALAVSNGGRGDISLYILISWLFWMGSHRWHWTVKTWLSALTVSNGGVNHQFYLGKSENLSSFQVLLLLHRALSFLIRNERPINNSCILSVINQMQDEAFNINDNFW